MPGSHIPRPLGFKNYLNNSVARLRNFLICVHLASPGYSSNKLFKQLSCLLLRAYVIHLYRVTHFNRRTRISRNLSQIEKNGWDKSYRGQRGPHNGAHVFDLELDFGVFSRSKWFFHMETPSFDPGFGKSRKFYVQNHIKKFFPRSFQGQI